MPAVALRAMKQLATQLVESARRLFTSPLSELNRWQLTARYAVGIARYGAHELKDDRASQMAAALTYRTIFSLVPLFVLSLLVFNAFGGFASVGGDLQETIYDYLGLDAITIEAAAPPADSTPPKLEPVPPAPGEPTAPPPLGNAPPLTLEIGELGADKPSAENLADTKARVDDLLADLQAQVASVNLTSISLVGLGVLIWAGLSLVVSLETCFNRVYHAPQGRPWHLRITIYWATITLGPVLVALSFYLTNSLVQTAETLDAFGLIGFVFGIFAPFASLAATWLLLVLIYKLLPNAKVNFRAALIGGLVAAILWEASKWSFRLYVDRAVGYSALYGSLGLVPLFLLWIYLTWLVILFGLEISYVIQTVGGSRFLRPHKTPDSARDALVESHCVLAVTVALGRAFDRGEAMSVNDLSSAVRLPGGAVESLVQALTDTGLIHPEEGHDEGPGDLRLSRPAETIDAAELLRVGRAAAASPTANPDAADTRVFDSLRAAQDRAVQGKTLRDLIGPAHRDDGTEEPETTGESGVLSRAEPSDA
ncbi:MAG: YhjD/YihY/BrkB family envelope integrity protein [Planctomycetota bacterium]